MLIDISVITVQFRCLLASTSISVPRFLWHYLFHIGVCGVTYVNCSFMVISRFDLLSFTLLLFQHSNLIYRGGFNYWSAFNTIGCGRIMVEKKPLGRALSSHAFAWWTPAADHPSQAHRWCARQLVLLSWSLSSEDALAGHGLTWIVRNGEPPNAAPWVSKVSIIFNLQW